MAQILAGKIIRAVDLNYPVVLNELVSGGPTSGSGLLTIGTLVVPAQPIATVHAVSMSMALQTDSDGADDRWELTIYDGSTSGAIVGQRLVDISSASGAGTRIPVHISGPPKSVAANTAATYLATLQRILLRGTGGTAQPHGATSTLQALVLPDRS